MNFLLELESNLWDILAVPQTLVWQGHEELWGRDGYFPVRTEKMVSLFCVAAITVLPCQILSLTVRVKVCIPGPVDSLTVLSRSYLWND